MKKFTIAVMPGDGIGLEVVPPCFQLVRDAAEKVGGFDVEGIDIEAGAGLFLRTGEEFPEESFQAAANADAILLGAMGLPSVRHKDGREIAPQLVLRERLDLYAGVRPVKFFKGMIFEMKVQDYPGNTRPDKKPSIRQEYVWARTVLEE